MTMALILGGVIFNGFEIPEKVPLGGKQAHKIHKLPGGVRIIDTKGPDDNEIKWKGRFRSITAIPRAQSIDSLRRAGIEVPLIVLGMVYTVVITSFTFDILRPYEVDYDIELTVVSDDTQGLGLLGAIVGLAGSVAGDVAIGAGLIGGFL